MTNQRYSFQSVWNIAAPRTKVWQVMTATPFSWDQWWPQLQNLQIIQTTPELTGTTFHCSWAAPLGYRLYCRIVIAEVVDIQEVTLQVDGDLRGTVTCTLYEVDQQTRVEVDWQVQTTLHWMNRLAPILRPLFVWGHHAVMRSGERGLRKYIQQP